MKEIIKAFVIKHNKETIHTKETVLCFCYESGEMRLFEPNFFASMKLFKGKNVWFEITIDPPSMIIHCHESKENWLMQKWNYYAMGKF